MHIRWISLISVVLAAAPAVSAHAESERKFSGEAAVNVVEVPVRVVDPATGEAVTGLRASDFRVFEQGVEQEITNFFEVGRPGSLALEASTTPAADRTERQRQIVYFFDLFLMMKGDRDRSVRAVQEAYARDIGPNEVVSVVSFDGTLRTHLDRSRDRRRIARALEEVASLRTRGVNQRIAFTQALADTSVSGERDANYYERRQRGREYLFEMEQRVSRVGRALSATLARFAKVDGRKAVIAFTPGQPAASWAPSFAPVDFFYGDVEYPVQELWKGLALEAADLGFTLYFADSSGIDVGVPGDASEGIPEDVIQSFSEQATAAGVNAPGNLGPEGAEESLTNTNAPTRREDLGNWLSVTRKNMLISAAELTGGEAFFINDVEQAVDGVADQLGHWYSIAYAVPHGGDGKTYEIKVTLPGHPDFGVTHRMQYVDRTASAREAEGMRSAMLFGADANPLGIRVETGEEDSRFRLGASGSRRVRIPIAVKIPIGRLDMVPRGDVFWGKVLITLFGQDGPGNQSPLTSHEQPITIPTDQIHQAATEGYFTYRVTVEIEGGEQRVYVGVKDQISGKMSVVATDFR